jgi:hypothetical protein
LLSKKKGSGDDGDRRQQQCTKQLLYRKASVGMRR